ncbi:MAG TPA: hypothetical protein VIS73_06620, partial [Rhodocyclaceae bacterium]
SAWLLTFRFNGGLQSILFINHETGDVVRRNPAGHIRRRAPKDCTIHFKLLNISHRMRLCSPWTKRG